MPKREACSPKTKVEWKMRKMTMSKRMVKMVLTKTTTKTRKVTTISDMPHIYSHSVV